MKNLKLLLLALGLSLAAGARAATDLCLDQDIEGFYFFSQSLQVGNRGSLEGIYVDQNGIFGGTELRRACIHGVYLIFKKNNKQVPLALSNYTLDRQGLSFSLGQENVSFTGSLTWRPSGDDKRTRFGAASGSGTLTVGGNSRNVTFYYSDSGVKP